MGVLANKLHGGGRMFLYGSEPEKKRKEGRRARKYSRNRPRSTHHARKSGYGVQQEDNGVQWSVRQGAGERVLSFGRVPANPANLRELRAKFVNWRHKNSGALNLDRNINIGGFVITHETPSTRSIRERVREVSYRVQLVLAYFLSVIRDSFLGPLNEKAPHDYTAAVAARP